MESQLVGAPMAKKAMGRPKTSARRDVSIKFDKILAGKARLIAQALGISMVEYLSQMSRPHIDKDYARIMREFEAESGR